MLKDVRLKGLYGGHIGIMEIKLETTIQGLGFRIPIVDSFTRLLLTNLIKLLYWGNTLNPKP